MNTRRARLSPVGTLAMTAAWLIMLTSAAHHSFAMYDQKTPYVFTGVVTRVSPDASHSQISFAALNEARDSVISSLQKSLPYYRLVYGTAGEQPRDSNGCVWFHLERNTRLGLEEASPGQAPAIAHYAIKVAPFDRSALEARLRELGTRMLPSADEPDVVRFADNNGIIVEVRVAQ